MYPTASKAKRFADFCIDRAFWYGLTFLFGLMIGLPLEIAGVKLSAYSEFVGFFLIGAIVWFFYYVIPESRSSRTLGKYVTGNYVLTTRAQRITLMQSVKRNLVRLVPFIWITLLVDNNARSAHDRAGGAVVVEEKSVPLPLRSKHGKAVKLTTIVIGGLFIASPFVALLGDMAYEAATGGERITLPTAIPADLRLTKYEHLTDDDNDDYYRMTYTGDGREVEITRLIADFEFEPDEDCIYTEPTPKTFTGIGHVAIDSSLQCTPLADGSDFVSKSVSGQSSNPDIDAITPDYILLSAPYRYAIQVKSGSLSHDEVAAMTNSAGKDFTASALQAEAARNR